MDSSAYLGIDVRTSAHPGNAFWNNDVDGSTFVYATVADMQAIGFSVGSARRFIEKRNRWLVSYSWPPSDTLDMNDPDVAAEYAAVMSFDLRCF